MPSPGDRILYKDRSILALAKNAGEPVQPDRSGDPSLFDQARAVLGHEPYLVHRIDRPVSGVVVFASTRSSAAQLSQLFKGRNVTKTYWAVVDAAPPATEGRLEHEILFDRRTNRSRAVATRPAVGIDDGKRASLSYRLVGKSDRYWLLELTPETGRHHQIRAQLAAVGCHIKGDVKYGARRTNPGGGISLHARSVSFTHPGRERVLTITAPPPEDPLWLVFTEFMTS